MWYREEDDNAYVLSNIDGLCIEYCKVYKDKDGNRLYVPDSLLSKFRQEFGYEDWD